MDNDSALHGRHARAQVPHDGSRQHVRHVQGDGHPRQELRQDQGVPGGADDGHGAGEEVCRAGGTGRGGGDSAGRLNKAGGGWEGEACLLCRYWIAEERRYKKVVL